MSIKSFGSNKNIILGLIFISIQFIIFSVNDYLLNYNLDYDSVIVGSNKYEEKKRFKLLESFDMSICSIIIQYIIKK